MITTYNESHLNIFIYAGPIVAFGVYTIFSFIISALVVLIYSNRNKLKKIPGLYFVTKPFHKLIKRRIRNIKK